jgi:hypothetical protein
MTAAGGLVIAAHPADGAVSAVVDTVAVCPVAVCPVTAPAPASVIGSGL